MYDLRFDHSAMLRNSKVGDSCVCPLSSMGKMWVHRSHKIDQRRQCSNPDSLWVPCNLADGKEQQDYRQCLRGMDAGHGIRSQSANLIGISFGTW